MATGKKLVIVESPTKAKKIGGYLGKDYTVLASVGHIRDLAQPSQVPAAQKAKYGKFGVDIDDGFKPYYIVDGNKKKTVAELKAALKDADELYLATDEDREGEAIAWHLVQTLKPKVPVKRMVFHEITPEAIKGSLSKTRDVDAAMVSAQETRRVLDRLYGYELSPVLWRKVGPGLSAGRVQSVATRLIVERERERMAFVQKTYWDVVASLKTSTDPQAFDARLVELGGHRLAASKDFGDDGALTAAAKKDQPLELSQADAANLAQTLKSADYTVASLETKPYHRRSSAPFTTSTLQQAAGNRLGMSSRAAMRAAQGLYENGYITYMRTDSVTLSGEAIAAAREQVKERFGEEYLSKSARQFTTTTAGAQEAHEAIRPSGSHFHTPEELATKVPPDQLKLYTLIWRRTLATQMADAQGSTATVKLVADAGAQGEATFQASGTVITFPGFTKVYGMDTESLNSSKKSGSKGGDDRDGRLPQMDKGDVLSAEAIEPTSHQTQPPARYTEASLVKTLEAKEIGRPSTYASIISTIIDRGYVYEKGRALIPSWLAFSVVKLLETKFPKLVDYEFTAKMENGLDQIANGKETEKEWLTQFYFGNGENSASDEQEATEGLQAQVAQLGEIDARAINTIEIGDGINVRVGRYGPYLEDTKETDKDGNFKRASIPDTIAPDELTIDVAHDLIEKNAGGARALGTDPATGYSVEVRNGRFGPYVALVKPEEPDSSDSEKPAEAEKKTTKAKSSKSSKAKAAERPKMASLFKTMDPQSIGLDDALKLLSLPREVGKVEETDATTGEISEASIVANNGRYGPYLTKTGADGKSDTRSLGSEDEIFTVTLDQAKELFAQPKYRGRGRGAAKPPLRELGADPDNGKNVTIKDGFYGAYITDGETNRTLPKQWTPESIDPAEAFRLLAEKRAAGPTKRRTRSTAKKSSAKKTTRKKASTKTTTAHTVKKGAARKKAAAK
jgi:DNA topoisomerase-1